MDPEFVEASGADAGLWDSIVSRSPHGTIFHTWKWQKIVEKHTGSRFYPLICRERDEPVGLLPIYFTKKFFMRMAFSPPPGTALNFLGPVLAGYESQEQARREQVFVEFQKTLDRFLKENLKPGYVSISLPYGLPDPRPFIWAGYRVENSYDYMVDLRPGADALWDQIGRKLRQNIARASSRGMTVEEGARKELGIIHELMVERYREQGRQVSVSLQYLNDLYEHFRDNLKVLVVRYEGEVVTGMIDVISKDQVFSWIGNPRPRHPLSPSPNDLLTWEGIRNASGTGFTQYITIGAAGNKRLHWYYASKFNPDLRVRYTVKRSTFIARLLERTYSRFLESLTPRFQFR